MTTRIANHFYRFARFWSVEVLKQRRAKSFLQNIFALCMKPAALKKFRFEIPVWLPDSPRRARLYKNRTRIKPLFHRTICKIGIFAQRKRAIAMSSREAMPPVTVMTGFAAGFGPLTHNAVEESLFFSLRCSKPNVVQVDPRPH